MGKKRGAPGSEKAGGGGGGGGSDAGGGGGAKKKQKVSGGGKPSSHQPRSLVEALGKGGKVVDLKKAKKNKAGGGQKKPSSGGDGKDGKDGKGGKGGKGKGGAAAAAPVDRKTLKPNYTLVEGLKAIWNTVRVKATPADVRSKLVQQMAAKMEGHIMQVGTTHS